MGEGPPASPPATDPLFDRPVPLVLGRRRLRAWSFFPAGAERYRIAVAGAGAYSLAPGGRRVRQIGAEDPETPPEALVEVLLGPVLVLALALQGAFCLHASAVAGPDGRAILFIGDSGRGKSTLAAFLAGRPGWQRLTDDVTPVSPAGAVDDAVEVQPRFPQLKLPPAPPPPAALPLAAVCGLEHGNTAELRRLPAGEAASATVQHTVASRLFDRPLLTSHLALAARLADVGVWVLAFPRNREALPAVHGLLEAHLVGRHI